MENRKNRKFYKEGTSRPYVKTTFTTIIEITCGCGANADDMVLQEIPDVKEIDEALHKLRCWLVDEAQWVRINGKIICGKCNAMFDKKEN